MQAIGIHGNKGGVGKSTIALSLAITLKDAGYAVGFLDADIDSPYAAEVLGLQDKVNLDDARRMVPVYHDDMPVMSFSAWFPETYVASTMEGGTHQVWLRDAIHATEWGELDLLIVDFPAGSGDEFITVRQTLDDHLIGLIGVGQPHVESGLARVYENAANHKIRILGMIENMSGDTFGHGTVKAFCEARGLTYLGSVPLDKRIRERHQDGNPQLPEDLRDPIHAAVESIEDHRS